MKRIISRKKGKIFFVSNIYERNKLYNHEIIISYFIYKLLNLILCFSNKFLILISFKYF